MRAAPPTDRSASSAPLPRDEVLRLFRAADASRSLLDRRTSRTRVVESLAVGTPVIATRGRRRGRGRPRRRERAARAGRRCRQRSPRLSVRFYGERRLRATAARGRSATRWPVRAPERALARLEAVLVDGAAMRKLLMVGRTRYSAAALRRPGAEVCGACGRARRPRRRFLGSTAPRGDEHVQPLRGGLPVLDGAAFYGALPFRVARELRRFRPDAVTTQSPYEAWPCSPAAASRARGAALIVELHGDWRTFPRLYGSPLRRALSPRSPDRVAPWALRHADAVRTLSPVHDRPGARGRRRTGGRLHRLHRPGGVHRASSVELPAEPRALFVGVLEPYKNIENLAAAWRLVAERVPGASLRLIGDGHRREFAEPLVAEFPDRVTWTPREATEQIVRALDDAWVLLLPSRAEGTPRIVLEAFCRAAPSSAAASVACPTLWRTASAVCWSTPTTWRGSRTRRPGCSPTATRPSGWAAPPASARREFVFTPEEFAARTSTLVERVVERR